MLEPRWQAALSAIAPVATHYLVEDYYRFVVLVPGATAHRQRQSSPVAADSIPSSCT